MPIQVPQAGLLQSYLASGLQARGLISEHACNINDFSGFVDGTELQDTPGWTKTAGGLLEIQSGEVIGTYNTGQAALYSCSIDQSNNFSLEVEFFSHFPASSPDYYQCRIGARFDHTGSTFWPRIAAEVRHNYAGFLSIPRIYVILSYSDDGDGGSRTVFGTADVESFFFTSNTWYRLRLECTGADDFTATCNLASGSGPSVIATASHSGPTNWTSSEIRRRKIFSGTETKAFFRTFKVNQ